MAIRSLQKRFSNFDQPCLDEADFGENSPTLSVKAAAYDGMASERALGVNPDHIISKRNEWPTTRFDLFVANQCLMLKALRIARQDTWADLKCASLFAIGTIFKLPSVDGAFAVHHATPHMARCLDLRENDGGAYAPNFTVSDITVTSLGHAVCSRKHTLLMDVDEGGGFMIEVSAWEPMTISVVRNRLHNMTKATLCDFAECLGMPRPSQSTKVLSIVHSILVATGVDDELAEQVIAKTEERLRRFKRKDPSGARPSVDEDADGGLPLDELPPEMATVLGGDLDFICGWAPPSRKYDDEDDPPEEGKEGKWGVEGLGLRLGSGSSSSGHGHGGGSASAGAEVTREKAEPPPDPICGGSEPDPNFGGGASSVVCPPSPLPIDDVVVIDDAESVPEGPDMDVASVASSRRPRHNLPLPDQSGVPHNTSLYKETSREDQAPSYVASILGGGVFEGQPRFRRSWATPRFPGARRTEEQARELCLAWLIRAHAAGATMPLPPPPARPKKKPKHG